MLEEQLQIVLGTWTQAPFSFSGSHYTLKDLDAQPKPVQSPHPPLIMGGSAGPRSVALAARYADEYNTPFATLEDVRTRKTAVASACEAAGRDPLPFSIMTGFLVGADEAELRDRAARLGERIGSTADALINDPPAAWIVGTTERAARAAGRAARRRRAPRDVPEPAPRRPRRARPHRGAGPRGRLTNRPR